jgi:putative tricarboxylic transport membrane protein
MQASRHRLPGEGVFALVMLLFGLTALWLAWRIAGFSSWSSPGVFPMLAAAAMSAAAIAIVRNTLRMKAVEISPGGTLARQFARRILPLPIVFFTALIVAYMLALERLGFVLSSFVYLVASMVALGERRLVRTVAISALSLAAIYLVFQTVFSVVLPEGLVERAFK